MSTKEVIQCLLADLRSGSSPLIDDLIPHDLQFISTNTPTPTPTQNQSSSSSPLPSTPATSITEPSINSSISGTDGGTNISTSTSTPTTAAGITSTPIGTTATTTTPITPDKNKTFRILDACIASQPFIPTSSPVTSSSYSFPNTIPFSSVLNLPKSHFPAEKLFQELTSIMKSLFNSMTSLSSSTLSDPVLLIDSPQIYILTAYFYKLLPIMDPVRATQEWWEPLFKTILLHARYKPLVDLTKKCVLSLFMNPSLSIEPILSSSFSSSTSNIQSSSTSTSSSTSASPIPIPTTTFAIWGLGCDILNTWLIERQHIWERLTGVNLNLEHMPPPSISLLSSSTSTSATTTSSSSSSSSSSTSYNIPVHSLSSLVSNPSISPSPSPRQITEIENNNSTPIVKNTNMLWESVANLNLQSLLLELGEKRPKVKNNNE